MKKIYKLVCSAFLVVSTLSAQDKWDTDGRIKYWLRSQIRPKIS